MLATMEARGRLSVTIPGTLRALQAAHRLVSRHPQILHTL